MQEKPLVMISFVEGGENGGPYNSHIRIMESDLKNKYQFLPLNIPKGRMGIFNIKLVCKLVRDIRIANPDIIHIGGLQLSGFYLALASRLANKRKILLAIHGSTKEAMDIPIHKKIILKSLEVLTLKMAAGTYAVSNYVSDWKMVRRHSSKFLGRIYNMAIVSEKKEEYATNNSIRKELGINDDELIIVSTGRITKDKGFEVLTDAVKKMNNYNGEVRFVIVGDGPYLKTMQTELKNEISSNKVFLLGYRTDIDRILYGSDIFVICTLHETLCMSLLEAAKCGLALVASNVGGIPEIVENDYNGYLIPLNDSQAVRDALCKLVSDPNTRSKFSNNSKKVVKERFSDEEIINQIDIAYRSLIDG
ncbi:glycosyltransferase [Paenibacillus sp. LHD-117]|uniref:glycosyltransferase n=1 Tax=Paenibacillus sp. LHD-117 TaxID=3071412 RepID=UPI0027E19A9E|nr:glycosyltransferase [Paenibacillus sp. LHD-117]MDQ6420679.1 glycosyltransferase [Paenibacillus sp. LHD-117]